MSSAILLVACATCLLLAVPSCHGDSGVCATPGANWEATHLPDVGLCVYTESQATRSQYDRSSSVARCNLATQAAGLTHMARPDSEQTKVQLINALFKNAFGYLTMWTDASCDVASSRFVWSNGKPVSPETACSSTSQLLYFSAQLQISDSSFVSSFVITTNASLAFIQMCEYDVPQCDPTRVTGYNNNTMAMSTTPHANKTVRFDCVSGYYRPSEIVLVGGVIDKTATASNNLFYCLYKPGAGIGSAEFVQVGSMQPIEICKPSSCQGWQLLNTTIIPDVEDYRAAVEGSRDYLFNEAIALVCKKGYVNVADDKLTTASLVCGQSYLNPSLGMWTPESLVVCTALRCQASMPLFDSTKMAAYKARDSLKDKSYTSDESNRFPYYPNEVSIKCRNAGQFFMDRTYDKSLKCDLPGNGTNNSAIWFPSGSTVLSSDIMNCQPITCLTKEIVIGTQQADVLGYLTKSSFNDSLTITESEDKVTYLSIKDFTTTAALSYGTKVRFDCKKNYLLSVLSDTGRSELVNSTEVTCATTGTWSFKVSSCIKQTESLVLTGGSGKYVPPAQEAAGAQSLGLIVIIILIVFFSTILILDLTTIARDVKLLRTNLRRIKMKIAQRKST